MISFLTSFVQTAASTKERYSLDQILAIMLLRNKKVKLEEIAKAVGHSKNSVTYKSLWIGKQVTAHGDACLPEIYKKFKVEAPVDIEADVLARVEAFLTGEAAAEVVETEE